ncbi:MAG: TetR family transcriptional regulator [Chloroflexales bacterium]
MTAKGEDRRIQRTRSALRRALVELMLEQGYEAITIQAIIDRANVGRSTFYAHYLDKYQLLRDNLSELGAMLTLHQQAALATQGGLAQGQFAFSLGMFDHAASHAQLYRALVGKPSGVVVQGEIQQILSELARNELRTVLAPAASAPLPLDVVVQYVVSAFMGLLVWWLEAGLPCTAAVIDTMFQRLTLPGVNALRVA